MNTIIVVATLPGRPAHSHRGDAELRGRWNSGADPGMGPHGAEGRNYVSTAWWSAFFPGLAIFLVVMSLNFLGDWLRDRLDPRLRQLS